MATLDLEQHADIPIQYGRKNIKGSPLNNEDISPTEPKYRIPGSVFRSENRTSRRSVWEPPFGSVPIRSKSDNKTVFDAYQIPLCFFGWCAGVIALVMVDYGLSRHIRQKRYHRPASLCDIRDVPYSREIQDKIDLARASHEIWLDTPHPIKILDWMIQNL